MSVNGVEGTVAEIMKQAEAARERKNAKPADTASVMIGKTAEQWANEYGLSYTVFRDRLIMLGYYKPFAGPEATDLVPPKIAMMAKWR